MSQWFFRVRRKGEGRVVTVASVAFLGVENHSMTVAVRLGKENIPFSYDGVSKVLRVQIDMLLTGGFEVMFH